MFLDAMEDLEEVVQGHQERAAWGRRGWGVTVVGRNAGHSAHRAHVVSTAPPADQTSGGVEYTESFTKRYQLAAGPGSIHTRVKSS